MFTKSQIELFRNGFLNPDGSPNKTKLNIVSGAYTPELAEAVWELTGKDKETIDHMATLFEALFEDGEDTIAYAVIELVYGLLGYNMPDELSDIAEDPGVLRQFLYEFNCDLAEVFDELAAEG